MHFTVLALLYLTPLIIAVPNPLKTSLITRQFSDGQILEEQPFDIAEEPEENVEGTRAEPMEDTRESLKQSDASLVCDSQIQCQICNDNKSICYLPTLYCSTGTEACKWVYDEDTGTRLTFNGPTCSTARDLGFPVRCE